RTPFGDESPAKLLIMHQTIYPTSVRLIRPEVPEGLEKIVDKMMDKDPDQRYQVPIEVAQALEPWTRTPIPPPSEEELPRLSPAIRAENPEPRVVITPRPGNRGVQTGADIEITPHNTPGRRTVPEQAP